AGARAAPRTAAPPPASSSAFVAPSMRSRSDSEPTRIPTSGPSGIRGDVGPEAHAAEIYAPGRVVGRASRRLDRGARADDVEDAAAVRHELPVVQRRARVEHERAGRFRLLDPLDRRAAVVAAGRAVR